MKDPVLLLAFCFESKPWFLCFTPKESLKKKKKRNLQRFLFKLCLPRDLPDSNRHEQICSGGVITWRGGGWGWGGGESGSHFNYKNPAITTTAVHAHHAGWSQTLSPHSPAQVHLEFIKEAESLTTHVSSQTKTCVPLAPQTVTDCPHGWKHNPERSLPPGALASLHRQSFGPT